MLCLFNKEIKSNLNNSINVLDINSFKSDKVSILYNNINTYIENQKLNKTIEKLDTVVTTSVFDSINIINEHLKDTLIILLGFNTDIENINEINNKKNNILFFYGINKNIFKCIIENKIKNIIYIFNLKKIITNIFPIKEKTVDLLNSREKEKKINKKIKLSYIMNFIKKVNSFCVNKNISVISKIEKKLILGNIVISDMYDYDNTLINKLFDIYNVLVLSNILDKKENLEYIYDYVCEYLDNEFKRNNYCDFCNDLCVANRNKKTPHENNGCCYYITYEGFLKFKNNGLCKNQVNKTCQIKCIGCKLFTCRYYKRQGIIFTTNNIFLLKHYLDSKEKLIVKLNLYTDKNIVINKLLEKDKKPYFIYLLNKSYSIKKIPRF